MRLNEFQQKAVEEFDRDLLLLAGAGTGKTRVLTEKYLRLIQEKGLDPRRIVAITFTQKAALEMRGRIREAMNQRYIEAEEFSAKKFWEQQLKAIEEAYIGTFHGLCGNILRENSNATGVISGMRVLSEGEERILLASSAEMACIKASHQGTQEERELFWNAVIQFGLNFFLEQLRSCFPKIRESGLPVSEWVLPSTCEVQTFNENNFIKLQETVRDILRADARRNATENSRNKLQEIEERYHQIVPEIEDDFTECTAKLRELKSLVPKTMGRLLLPYIEEIHEAMNQLLSEKSQTEFQKWAGCISRFFALMSEAYTEEKRLQNALDFTDLQIKTRDLLRDKPDLRRDIQRRYDYFLVDEFQDTNLLQLEIVRLLAGNIHTSGRLFVVGDAKQSIYRFRGAQVQVVKDLDTELQERNGQILPLVENYRCHPAIIDLINFISEYTFHDDEIEYQGLVASRSNDFDEIARMRILPNTSESRSEEAERLADYIHYLVEIEQPPVDLGDGRSRKLRYGDIALLLRTMTHVEEYTAAFEKRRIPFTLGSGSGYYGLQEVQDQLNLIRLVQNCRDGIALLALLRSPYAGLSDADLFWLAQEQGDLLDTFYHTEKAPQGIAESTWHRTTRLRNWIIDQQKKRAFLTASEIIRKAMNDLGYLQVIAAFPGAEKCLANMDKLLHKADSFTEVSGRYGLGQFIEYVGKMLAFQEREGEANLESEGSDALQLMTIHASKGLEFPLVILADLEHKLFQPERSSVIYHPRIGLGFKVPDGAGNMYEPPVRNRIKEMNQREERSEFRRLLYVALTRARDYLVLSGIAETSAPETEGKSWSDWLRACFPADALKSEDFQLADRNVKVIKEIPEVFVDDTDQRANNWWDMIQSFDETAATTENELIQATREIKPWKISVTSLLAYLECPRNYFLVYRLGLENESDPDSSEGGSAFGALIGRIVHALCALDIKDPTEIKERINRGVSGVPQEERALVEESISILFDTYRKSAFSKKYKQEYSEYPFTINFGSLHRIHGIIDRLIIKEDETQLIDFKTNHIRTEKELSKLAEHYKPQILTYAYAVRRIFKSIPRSELFFLDKDYHHPFIFTEAELDKWGNIIEQTLVKITQGVTVDDFPARTDCMECSRRPWCPK